MPRECRGHLRRISAWLVAAVSGKVGPEAPGGEAKAVVLGWDVKTLKAQTSPQMLLTAEENSRETRASTAFTGESGRATAKQGR